MPTVGETARALRERPLGRVLIFLAIILVALLVSRSCGATTTRVSQDQAIATAKRQVDFVPNNTMIRLLKRGFRSRPFWAVSLSQRQGDGTLRNVTVVVVDATSGDVAEVRRSS